MKMKNWLILMTATAMVAACSKSDNSSPAKKSQQPPVAGGGNAGGGDGGAAPAPETGANGKVGETYQDHAVTVLEGNKLSRLANDQQLATLDGAIIDTRNLSRGDIERIMRSTVCLAATADKRVTAPADYAGKTYKILQTEERVETDNGQTYRQVAIVLDDVNTIVACLRFHNQNAAFTWAEVQKSVNGILKIKRN